MASKEERLWMAAICRIGCIVCVLTGKGATPGVPHHLLSGGRRIGHMSTICLCDPGHHQYPEPGSGKVARHPTLAQFEAAYGSEEYLLEKTRLLVFGSMGLAGEPEWWESRV
jgi:hypothetical protein